MIRILLLGAFSCLPFLLAGQTIKGTVKDAKTGQPLPFANVFLNNSMAGATSDKDGNYSFTAPTGFAELIASYVGYVTQTRGIMISTGETLQAEFSLTPDNKELDEIKVTATRDKAWEKKMKEFEKEFLGKTPNARKSEILNPWVINFNENDDKTLMASAEEPVEVENLALGYHISVQILVFSANDKIFYFLAKMRFTELTPEDEKKEMQWIRNREEAYYGSERHLFAALIKGTAEKEGFELYTELNQQPQISRSALFSLDKGKKVIPFTIVVFGGKQNQYTLPLTSRVEVHYRNDNDHRFYRDDACRVYWIEPIKPPLVMNPSGVLKDPTAIKTYGYAQTMRMADTLPMDYVPTKKAK